MKETGILFTQAMDDAAQAGIKTMTRRIITVPWKKGKRVKPYEPYFVESDGRLLYADDYGDYHPMENRCPYGGIGDRLYQKEPFTVTFCDYNNLYVAGEYKRGGWFAVNLTQQEWDKFAKWEKPYSGKSSLFMFKSLARKWYTITSVRVERLQDITQIDAMKEGVQIPVGKYCIEEHGTEYINEFSILWDSINKDRASWESNPWVFVIEFRKESK